jgi:hypothetical protein
VHYWQKPSKNAPRVFKVMKPSKMSHSIPKTIWMTYHDKTRIPTKVYDNLTRYASDYTLKIYDDQEGLNFLKEFFDDPVIAKYQELHGPHKADLLRYGLLYVYGGVYLDIKTELIRPISEVIQLGRSEPMKDPIIAVKSNYSAGVIYQGVLAAPRGQPIFLDLINYIVVTSIMLPRLDYLAYVKDFYNQIENDIGRAPSAGKQMGRQNVYYLFEEECCRDATQCHDGLDRYGLCCFITDRGHRVIKTRFADYPWPH